MSDSACQLLVVARWQAGLVDSTGPDDTEGSAAFPGAVLGLGVYPPALMDTATDGTRVLPAQARVYYVPSVGQLQVLQRRIRQLLR